MNKKTYFIKLNNESVVIEIDFGTLRSGFAFVYPHDSSETVFFNETWVGDYFSNDDEGTEKYSLYSFYKIHLFNPKTRGQPIKSVCGNHSATIQELITQSLKYLKSVAMDKVNLHSTSSKKVYESEVQWVLTIHSIWDDSSKQAMRSCADTAGLCSKDDRESLIFSYELEAGALQCIFEKTTGYSVHVGQKFMVIDNGGVTSDIICYEQLEGGKLKSISRSFGGDFGSSYVNNKFILFLKKVFGDDIIEKRKKSPHFQSLLDKFEFLKKKYNRELNHIISLEFFPMTLFHEDENWLNKKIEEFNSKTGFKLRYSSAREKIIFPNDLFHFSNHYSKAGLAVAMGAVRFGLNPNRISTKKQTRSYAIEVFEEVTPDKPHTGKSIIKIKDTLYCENVCDVIVHANQMVGFDEVFTRPYFPITSDQKSIMFSIFSSHIPTMSYRTDPGAQFIGHLYIDIPNVGAPIKENLVEVSFKFVSTEIEAKAIHVKSGKELRHYFDFAIDEAESLRRYRLRKETLDLIFKK
ncbi:hypothetical protein ACTFIY_009349 [Dictyostelium cf. discoideum]